MMPDKAEMIEDMGSDRMDPHSDASADNGKRPLLLAGLLFVVVAGIAWFLVSYMVSDRRSSVLESAKSRMEAVATGQAEVLNTWLEGHIRTGRRLTESDLVRLFSHELRLQTAGQALDGSLGAQLPYMQQTLADFGRENGLVQTYLSDLDGKVLLTSRGGIQPSPQVRSALSQLANGRRVSYTPVYDTSNGLSTDIVMPIMAPQSSAEGPVVTAALILTLPMQTKLTELLESDAVAQEGDSRRILQWPTSNGEQIVLGSNGIDLRPLEAGFQGGSGQVLPFQAVRSVGGADRFAVGIPLRNAPLTIVQESDANIVLGPVASFRWTSFALIGLGLLSVGGGFFALVMRQRGQHHEEMATQYMDLATQVQRHKVLLESITNSIREMIGLKGLDGRYTYVNPAFAEMVGRPMQTVIGAKDQDLFPVETAAMLAGRDDEAMTIGQSRADDELIKVNGVEKFVSSSKVPMRDDRGNTLGIITVARDVTEIVEQRKRREQANRQTVMALVRAIELSDPYLVGHSRRLRHFGLEIGRRLGLSERDLNTLDLAASMSQLGKIFIPPEILRKPGRHTPAESRIMRSHITRAYEVLRDIDFELPVAETVVQIYERLDGSGYPKGLNEPQITTPARILAVVDVFCARTSPRSYRGQISPAKALYFLAENGGRYDIRVIRALAAIIETGGYEAAEAEVAQQVRAEQERLAMDLGVENAPVNDMGDDPLSLDGKTVSSPIAAE